MDYPETFRQIVEWAVETEETTEDRLLSWHKTGEIVRARSRIIVVARALTPYSYPEIGVKLQLHYSACILRFQHSTDEQRRLWPLAFEYWLNHKGETHETDSKCSAGGDPGGVPDGVQRDAGSDQGLRRDHKDHG